MSFGLLSNICGLRDYNCMHERNMNCIYYCSIVTLPGDSVVCVWDDVNGMMVHDTGEVRCLVIGLIPMLFLCTEVSNDPALPRESERISHLFKVFLLEI